MTPMIGEAGTWRAPGGTELGVRMWRPTGKARGHLALIHGYAEHGGRYGRFAEAVAARGLVVHALDLRGHGVSPGRRGDMPGVDRVVGDVEAFSASLPGPTFLFGHSAGGAAAACAAARLPDLAGLLLTAPFLRNADPVPGWLRAVSGVVAAVVPHVPVRTLDLDALSRIPEEVEAYRDDPLVYTGPVQARAGSVMLNMGDRALELAPHVTVPTLVMHGTDDAIADPEGSRLWIDEVGHADAQLELVSGGYHELLNDLDRDVVTATLLGWLERHL